jgi:hypothetical protein
MDHRLARGGLNDALAALGELLDARGLHYELVLIGGASLLLRGVIARPTNDVDVLGAREASGGVVRLEALPEPLARAVADVGLACFKLYAAADRWPARDRHLDDLVALAPTPDEFLAAARWTRTHDPSPAFAENLGAVLRSLGVEDPDARRR